jgi:hypothetical protein
MIRPWKVVGRYRAKRRAARARAALAEKLFLQATERLLQDYEWRQAWPTSRRRSAEIIAEQVLNRRGVSPGDQDGQAQEPAPRSG